MRRFDTGVELGQSRIGESVVGSEDGPDDDVLPLPVRGIHRGGQPFGEDDIDTVAVGGPRDATASRLTGYRRPPSVGYPHRWLMISARSLSVRTACTGSTRWVAGRVATKFRRLDIARSTPRLR